MEQIFKKLDKTEKFESCNMKARNTSVRKIHHEKIKQVLSTKILY